MRLLLSASRKPHSKALAFDLELRESLLIQQLDQLSKFLAFHPVLRADDSKAPTLSQKKLARDSDTRKPQPYSVEACSDLRTRSAFPLFLLVLCGVGRSFLFSAEKSQPALFLFLLFFNVHRILAAAQELDYRHLGAVSLSRSKLQNPRITACSVRKPIGHFAKELVERLDTRRARSARALVAAIRNTIGVPGKEIRACQTPGMKSGFRRISGQSAPAEGYCPLGKRPELFCLFQCRRKTLVNYERCT